MSGIPLHLRAYCDAMDRGDHEEAARVMDQNDVDERASFDRFMREECGRPDLADRHAARLHEMDSGRDGARRTWHSISAAQRRALLTAQAHGGQFKRIGKEYRHRDRNQPYVPCHVTTLRNLCARELLAWDGGAFDPESAAVLTERGRFLLAWGPTPDPLESKP